jgi:hypothetical protein
MSIPRFSNLISAKKFNNGHFNGQNNENNNPGSQYSSSINTLSCTAMHPYEAQMFTHSSSELRRAEKNRNADAFNSGNISEVLKRNEYVIPKSWTEDQLLGTRTNSWQSSR